MATPRAPKGPQPALGGSDAAFKPFTDAAAASSSKSATAVDISDAKQTKEAAAVKQAVLKAISLQLKDTYRKANPDRPGRGFEVPSWGPPIRWGGGRS